MLFIFYSPTMGSRRLFNCCSRYQAWNMMTFDLKSYIAHKNSVTELNYYSCVISGLPSCFE
jgi:hypothetical protein